MIDEANARLGTRLGNYALKEIIGRGGMGVVYRASHIYIRKPAAVKVLHRRLFEQPGAKARFLGEALTASMVSHPNIVGVTDFGEAPDGTVYLVMAEAHGVGLDLVLEREGVLPLFRTLAILSQIVHALSAVHSRGIVHGDIKPENIMLARRSGRRELVRYLRDGEGTTLRIEPEECFDLVTILDFGAARTLQPNMQALAEQTRIFGTPAYLAPETGQSGHADARSEVYSVGVLFYEMLTGQVPFEGETTADTLRMHMAQAPQSPRERNPNVEITAEAEHTIVKALDKDPRRRQSGMPELWADLQRCYGAMRWRRPTPTFEGDVAFEALRAPTRVAPERMRRLSRPTPEIPLPASGMQTSAAEPQRPLLLTRRKSDNFKTVGNPEDVPTPPPAKSGGFSSLAKAR
ncbi:MAG TPA: serine/threonine-protein kinase [Polyangia bacterium]